MVIILKSVTRTQRFGNDMFMSEYFRRTLERKDLRQKYIAFPFLMHLRTVLMDPMTVNH